MRINDQYMAKLAGSFLAPLREALADGGQIHATAKSLDAARDSDGSVRPAAELCERLLAIVGQMMCSECEGSGTVEKCDWPGEHANRYQEPCPNCNGGTP